MQARTKIGALSNIDNASLASSCKKMGIDFDIIVTAERVGAYKPSWEHFNTALADLEAMGIPRERILHVGQSLRADRSEEHTSELQSLMRISYAVFCLKKKKQQTTKQTT